MPGFLGMFVPPSSQLGPTFSFDVDTGGSE